MDEYVGTFLRTLDAANTSTGGGAASAIAGAMAAALVGMVARLSIGKENMADEAFYEGVSREAESLSTELFRGSQEDEIAFAGIRTAYRLPRESADEKAERRAAVEDAIIHAARVPLQNGERCGRVLALCASLRGRSNPAAASDLECAGHLARAGVLGCVANILINVPSISDEGISRELVKRANVLRELAGGDT